jgi:ankyrin repeat protein
MKMDNSGLAGKITGAVFLLIIFISISGCASTQLKGARDGDLSAVKEYIDSGGDVNERQKNERTLLMYASSGGHVHIIDYLMSIGADIRLRDKRGYSALMYGVEANKNNSVVSLLSYDADINDFGSNGDTSLLLAAGRNFSLIVDTLLQNGADYNLSNNNGWTPALSALNHSAASSSGVTHSFMLLKDAGASLTSSSSSVGTNLQAYTLVKNKGASSGSGPQYKLVQNETSGQVETTSLSSSPLAKSIAFKAIQSGNTDVLSILFREGVQPDIKDREGNSLLHYSVGNIETVKFILTWNSFADIQNNKGETPLLKAVKEEYTDSVSFLLAMGADYDISDNNRWTPLLSALDKSSQSSSGLIPSVSLLMEKGARLEKPFSMADSIAFTSVESGNTDVLNILFREGVDRQIRDNSGNSLLHLGIGNIDMVRFLLIWKTDINSRNNNGIPVLHKAVENPSADVLNLLMVQGVNIFASDSIGNTALHSAARMGVPETVRQLLLAGIFVNSTNSAGVMPYEDSFENTKYGEEIREILKVAGAIIPPEPEPVDVLEPVSKPATPPVIIGEITDPVEDPVTVGKRETEGVKEGQKPIDGSGSNDPVTVQNERVLQFSWPRINPSQSRGWNNRDKLTGNAILTLKDSENNVLFKEEFSLLMKGVNADADQFERTVSLEPGQEFKSILTIQTTSGKSLTGLASVNSAQEGIILFSFDEFEYQ